MPCRRVLLFVTCSCVLVAPGWVRAQASAAGVGPSTPLPLVVDLKKVPVGSWSEYRVADGQNTMSIRMALVARSARGVDVETRIQGGPVAALGGTTVRMSLPLEPAAEVKPSQQVLQLGDHPPMLLPVDLGGARVQSFKKIDPKKRIGIESISVPGGTFPRADHYQEKGAAGETVDFWISDKILPFGLIKVASIPGGGGAVTMELTGHGVGAKPLITKTPQPFDAATIMKQAQPAMGGDASTSGKGGPPVSPIPSPHPGMPPTQPGSTAVPASAKGAHVGKSTKSEK